MPLAFFKHIKKHPPTNWHYKPLKKKRLFSWGWRIIIILILLGFIGFAGLLAWVSKDLPTPEGIARRVVSQSTKIYDHTGQIVLYDIHGEERRTSVNLSDIPKDLINATLTAEDRNFYEHKGFRLTSMIRAILINLIKGDKAQGGSTITQQFIKNAILSNEKTYIRKIKELVLAYQIEQKFTKDEILKLYLNEIPYGSNAYGAEAAAQTYFGKTVKDLSLAEAAALAGLPKAPSYYSPWGNHLDELIDRQHYILDAMVEQKYITQEQAEAAKNEKLDFKKKVETIIAPHFVFYVKEMLAQKYGERMVEQGGLKITTSLDVEKQKAAEEAIENNVDKITKYNASNAALVAINVSDGEILAMVGSRDYFNDEIQGQVNVALRPRQPGSSFKPIVYAKALSLGFTPETLIYDVITNFSTDPNQPYTPQDYDGKERGPISLRKALAGSLNIPAVKLLYLTQINNVLNLAEKLGYTTLQDRSRFGLALVLGGAEVKLLEHTNAYGALARGGVYKPTTAIIKVEDSNGNILEEFKDKPGEQVLDEQPVKELTNIMSDNEARSYIFGANNRLTLPGRPVAAKTGTTNDYHDAWTMGFTPDLAVGVWVGNNNNKAMSKGADGSVVAAPIWQDFFIKATQNTPIKEFTQPDTRPVAKQMLNGEIGGEALVIDKASGKLATDSTPDDLKQTILFKKYHTLLQYVTPGDPLGPEPTNPSDDPQYNNWESALKTWLIKNNLSDEQAPTEYDQNHNYSNLPQLQILSPQDNQTVQDLNFQTSASAPRGIKRVEYWLDDILIGTSTTTPFSLNYNNDTESGWHKLLVKVCDDIENCSSQTINFNYLKTSSSPTSWFNSPKPNSQINNNTISVEAETTDNNIKQVDLFGQKDNENSIWLGVSTTKNKHLFSWSPNQLGNYKLYLMITNQQNQTKRGASINVIIN